MSIKPGNPVWIDLGVPDLATATAFYGAAFGWTFADMGADFGHYHQIFAGDALVGGLMQNLDEADNEHVFWEVYFATDDLEATLAAAGEHGGAVVLPPMDVGDQGRMALITAPSGAQVGLWEARSLAGFDLPLTPGTPVWFDGATTDYAADLAFYRAVFGWDAVEPEPGYAVNAPAVADATAALFDAPAMFGGSPRSQWRVFFAVADIARAIETITAAGGRVTDGPEDTEWGPVATVVDASGAVFLIQQTPRPGGAEA